MRRKYIELSRVCADAMRAALLKMMRQYATVDAAPCTEIMPPLMKDIWRENA